jgi:hypothetical protein
MLKEMSKSGTADLLVSRPDVIPGIHRDYRSGMVLVKNYLEAVGERVFLELDPRCRLGICRGGHYGSHK